LIIIYPTMTIGLYTTDPLSLKAVIYSKHQLAFATTVGGCIVAVADGNQVI